MIFLPQAFSKGHPSHFVDSLKRHGAAVESFVEAPKLVRNGDFLTLPKITLPKTNMFAPDK